jgi:hypothetical protein
MLVVGMWCLGALLVTLRVQLGTAQLMAKRDSKSVHAKQGSRLVPLGDPPNGEPPGRSEATLVGAVASLAP